MTGTQILSGKRAIVFGDGGSIGAAVAKEFATEGAEVFPNGARPGILIAGRQKLFHIPDRARGDHIMSEVFYRSAEIRWFLKYQHNQLGEILKWFCLQGQLPLLEEDKVKDAEYAGIVSKPFVKQERQRTDEYLLFPDSDKTGVKQRQGRLEVKALVAGPQPYSLPSYRVTGRMDQWVKWSFASSDIKKFEADLSQAGPWRKVIKDRYLQKYSFDSGRIVAVSAEQQQNCGCDIELTKICVEANGSDWLTVGFEAFGPSGRVFAILDEAIEHFFTEHGSAPVLLDGRDSISYPTWLTLSQ